jgi:hypothetical protein
MEPPRHYSVSPLPSICTVPSRPIGFAAALDIRGAAATKSAFYERMPYPTPLKSLDAHRDLYKNPDRRRAEFHLIWPAGQPRCA